MALSGTHAKNVGKHWRLSIEWSGSQSVTGNYTDVTFRMYWEATSSYGAVYSSATKSGRIGAGGGSTSMGYGNFTDSAKLNANQKRLIHTWSRRISHANDGTATLTVNGYFDAEVTLAGSWFGRIDLGNKSFTLNRIPRKSTMSSSASFTAGSNRTITVNRTSSGFTHKVYIDIQNSSGGWENVKSIDFTGTSVSTSFSTADYTQIFRALNGRTSAPVRMNLYTYSGGTSLGYNQYTGNATAPSASSFTSGFNSSVYVDQSMSGSISRANSGFTHTVVLRLGNFSKSWTGLTTSWSWSPSAAESLQLAQRFPTKVKETGSIEITTYYNGIRVRSSVTRTMSFSVRNANPSFSASSVSYRDTNSTTIAITGNDQSIIQNKSKLRVTIGSGVAAKMGATFSKFIVRVGGKDGKLTSTTGNVDIGEVDSASNTAIFIDAIDSRGLKTTVSVNMNLIPYQAPVVSGKAIRQNGFEADTSIQVSATFDILKVGNVTKNIVQSVRYRYKERKGNTSWSSWVSLSFSTTGGKIVVTPKIQSLNNVKAWDVEFQVVDKLSTTTAATIVEEGQPIFFVHPDLRSLGFNDFPIGPNEFRFNGRMVFGANQWASNSTGEGFGAMDLKNSDITGLNGLFFNDVADNKGEGLLFLKSGRPNGSPDRNDYDTLYMRDGGMFLDNRKFMDISGTSVEFGGSVKIGNIELNGFNSLSNTSTTLYVRGANGIDLWDSSGGGDLILSKDSRSKYILSMSAWDRTYDFTANMYVTSNGVIGRATSASKYKVNISDVDTSNGYAERILDLKPKKWYGKAHVEDIAHQLDIEYEGGEPCYDTIEYLDPAYGLIAEDLIEAGLDEYVLYGPPNENGHREVEYIAYDRLWTLLIPVVKKQQEQIYELQQIIRERG